MKILKCRYQYLFPQTSDKYNMNANLDKIAQDLYGKIETRFTDIKIGDEHAEPLSRKEDIPKARFFEFDYIENGESLGTISISLDADDGVVVRMSGDLVDDEDDNSTHHGAYKFIRSFRKFARNRLLDYDAQNIGKSNLDKRDYEFHAKRKEDPVMAPIMENKMYGNAKISYQDLGEARLVVKHSKPINVELAAGRTQHIEAIYIENAQGERFRYPAKHLNGARALAEHIKHGGNPYDAIGKHITGLSEELASLRKFKGFVSRQAQVSEAMGNVTDKVINRIEEIKETIQKLQRAAYYETFAESFEENESEIIPEAIVDNLVDRLTIRTFNEEMKSVFPYIYKFIDESELPALEVNPDDLLGEENKIMSRAAKGNEKYGKDGMKALAKAGREGASEKVLDKIRDKHDNYDENFDPAAQFESFMENIVNEDKDELFSPNKAAKLQAVEKLNQIISQELPGGPEGINAIESLSGIIDDPEFLDMIKDLDPNLDVRPVLQQWLHDHPEKFAGDAAETMAMIHFSGTGEPEEMPAPEVPPAPAPEIPPAPEAEIPPAPGEEIPPAPGEEIPPAPVAESATAKLKAHFIKARAAGATLETVIDFGHRAMTLAEAIDECGMAPEEVGFEEEQPVEQGIPAMLKYISGFYNKDEGNFTIGGTRMKIKVKKAWEDGEFGDCGQEDVVKLFKLIDAKDPSHGTAHREHDHVMRLAGVQHQEPSGHRGIGHMEDSMKNIKLQFNKSTDPKDMMKNLLNKLK